MKLGIVAFTSQGAGRAEQLVTALSEEGHQVTAYCFYRYEREGLTSFQKLKPLVEELFEVVEGILFISATGIAVRAIAPYLKSKVSDPAVLVMDEGANFVISLLSGHIGGGNELAHLVADKMKATPVITTATDVNDKLAIDVWATKRNLYIKEMEIAKEVAARLLDEKKVGFSSSLARFGLEEYDVPMGLTREKEEVGVVVSFDEEEQPFERTLHLISKQIVLGVGCRKETKPEVFEEMVRNVLAKHQISRHAVCKLCSIDLKQEEKAILKLADKWNIPFETYSADELKKVQGTFTASSFVSQVTGVDNVCERSAVLGSRGTKRMKTKEEDREEDRLIVRKQAANGVTIALCIRREE